ncbi:MAG: CoA pyrophosphatase [Bacteroidota bacterium]
MKTNDLEKLRLGLIRHPNIMGKDEFFNSVVLIPLIKLNDEYHFLFEKRAANIRQGGEICFPGGAVDSADNGYIETALRETTEEIGVYKDKINILGSLNTLIGPRGITVDSFIATLDIMSIDDCKIDKTEVERIFLVPVTFFENNPPEKYKVVSQIKLMFYDENGLEENLIHSIDNANNPNDKSYTENVRNVLVYKTSGEIIWGITARLIFEVTKILRKKN